MRALDPARDVIEDEMLWQEHSYLDARDGLERDFGLSVPLRLKGVRVAWPQN